MFESRRWIIYLQGSSKSRSTSVSFHSLRQDPAMISRLKLRVHISLYTNSEGCDKTDKLISIIKFNIYK